MFSSDKWAPGPRGDVYTTPCDRFSVERTGAEAWTVWETTGPTVVDRGAFPTREEAIAEAVRLAGRSPIRAAKRTRAW